MREYNTIFDEFIQFKHFLGYKYKTDEIVINEIKKANRLDINREWELK